MGNIIRNDAPQSVLEAEELRLPGRVLVLDDHALGLQLERATVQILSQLEAAGYLTKTRVGRRNHYTVHCELPLRHPMHNGRQVGELLRVLEPEIPPRA
jgi:hypothetical protein